LILFFSLAKVRKSIDDLLRLIAWFPDVQQAQNLEKKKSPVLFIFSKI